MATEIAAGIYFFQMSSGYSHRARLSRLQWAVFASVFLVANAATCRTSQTNLPADCSASTSAPLPAEATGAKTPTEFPDCASYRSYRGIGRPIDYAKARDCAWEERLAQKAGLRQNQKAPTAWVVGGSLILADLYANGAGVERNFPLAVRFACEFEESAAEMALQDLGKQSSAASARTPFDFCHYAATTFTMNFCAGYTSEIEEDRRRRFFNKLKSSMNSGQEAAFEKLIAAQQAYVRAHAAEVDQGGTIRTIRIIGSQEILNDNFQADVVHFERKQWPALSTAQIAEADSLLHRELEEKLQQLGTRTEDEIEQGGVTARGLSSAQRAWKSYREAWRAFAGLRYPAAADAMEAKVTIDRFRLLKTIE